MNAEFYNTFLCFSSNFVLDGFKLVTDDNPPLTVLITKPFLAKLDLPAWPCVALAHAASSSTWPPSPFLPGCIFPLSLSVLFQRAHPHCPGPASSEPPVSL